MSAIHNNSKRKAIVVIGAGIIGLSTALELQSAIRDAGADVDVIIMARHTPNVNGAFEPTDGWCSPWAGAMHGCNVDGDEAADVLSYLKMKDQLDSGETIGLRYITQRDYWFKGAKSAAPTLGELKKVLRDLRIIPKDKLPAEAQTGLEYRTIVVDPLVYLPFLATKFEAAGGRIMGRTKVTARDIPYMSSMKCLTGLDVVAAINCAGLGAGALCSEPDTSLVPMRKQSILVRAPWHDVDYHSEDKDGWFWIMSRPGGLVNIGGLIQPGETDVAPRQEDTETMLEHALRVDRLLLPPEKQDDPNATWRDLDVVHVNVGIHFSRGVLGTRCELDTSSQPVRGPLLVHNYGHRSGYNSCFGYGIKVCKILQDQGIF